MVIKRWIRGILAIVVLVIAIALLLWGIWPMEHLSRVVSLPAGSLVVP